MTRRRLGLLLALGFGVGLAFFALPAEAQTFSLNLGQSGTFTGRIVQLIALLTVLSLAPSILVVMTSFTRIIVVLSLLRSALGTQSAPPNTVLVSLALFLTFFVMQPTLQRSYDNGIRPLIENQIDDQTAFKRSIAPLHQFMMEHVRRTDLDLFMSMGKVAPVANPAAVPLRVLIPAFLVGELKRAFEIGFLLYVPFVIIDMVVASILMSMGMMMIPPVMVSLPFKLIFFVLVNGWSLVASSLVRSFGAG